MGGHSSPPPPPALLATPEVKAPEAQPALTKDAIDSQTGLQNERARLNRLNELTARRVLSKPDPDEETKVTLKTLLGGS